MRERRKVILMTKNPHFPVFPDLTAVLKGLPPFLKNLPRFGEQLRDYRTLRGRSIEEVAAAVGLAPNALSDIEQGSRNPPPKDIIYALADTLGLSGSERASLIESADLHRSTSILNALAGNTPSKEARPELPAAILVFLIADIRGYTHFTEQNGDDAAARLTARFAELARMILEHWDGQLVEVRGDEVLGVFASARQALRAAHDLQARYADESRAHAEWPAGI